MRTYYSLGPNLAVGKAVQLLKGESSHWMNEQRIIGRKFEWQDEYFAVSVSEASIGQIRGYIRNQEEHHRIKSFVEEVDEFLGFTAPTFKPGHIESPTSNGV